jgi:hypothetical protein
MMDLLRLSHEFSVVNSKMFIEVLNLCVLVEAPIEANMSPLPLDLVTHCAFIKSYNLGKIAQPSYSYCTYVKVIFRRTIFLYHPSSQDHGVPDFQDELFLPRTCKVT